MIEQIEKPQGPRQPQSARIGADGPRTTACPAGSRTFCRLSSDGLGIQCARCGCWKRGEEPPECPPYITRSEPDGARLPHITTRRQNEAARRDYMAKLEAECAEPSPALVMLDRERERRRQEKVG